MIKKISYSLIKILTILIILQFVLIPVSHAGFWEDIFYAGDNFLADGKKAQDADSDSEIDDTQIQEQFNKIYNILFSLGVVLAVLVGAILGIKFMIGSVEEQAKIKETLIPYIIGCIIIFGAFGIWRIVLNIGNSVIGEPDKAYEQAAKLTDKVINGEKKVSELTDEELKTVFSNNEIARDIGTYVNREGKTVEEAVNKLSDYKKEIYNECKRRGLLSDSGMGLK